MARPEWGTKRTCYHCGAKFYDLRREPVVCPVCAGAAVYEPDKHRVRRGGAAVRDEPPVAAERLKVGLAAERREVEAGDEEVELDELEDQVDADADGPIEDLASGERELIEDTSDLGEDDDDIGELMEHVSEEGEDKV